SASWKDLFRALPWAIVGIIAGVLFLDRIDDRFMRPMIGGIVLLLLVLHLRRHYLAPAKQEAAVRGDRSGRRIFAAAMGCLGGFTTMLANAGGAVMSIYFLALGLSKETFIGTSAWFFFIVNLIKLPLMVRLGMISGESLGVNLAMVPALAAGTVVGIFIARRLDQKVFDIAVSVLTAAACIRLIF
ncbi:MAG: sulfite exporter TauE/SafE family protein, partial [Spirochaetaceae bacterium]|nr:sulfite exporter TauE/SafE family protein [Spirochaetaceae bacterium]